MNLPLPDRPVMPRDYGIPDTMEGSLPWSWAEERLLAARVYWLATLHPAGRPHLMPNWGVWLDGALIFSTSPETRKARNLQANPLLSAGVQDGEEAVIIEGRVETLTDRALLARMDDLYEAKYGMREEAESALRLAAHKIIALGAFPLTPTRWVFR